MKCETSTNNQQIEVQECGDLRHLWIQLNFYLGSPQKLYYGIWKLLRPMVPCAIGPRISTLPKNHPFQYYSCQSELNFIILMEYNCEKIISKIKNLISK